MEEEQEEVKKELIFIKDIFIKREEEEGGEGEEKEEEGGGGGQAKDNGDLSSQLHCSTPLCEWPQPAEYQTCWRWRRSLSTDPGSAGFIPCLFWLYFLVELWHKS